MTTTPAAPAAEIEPAAWMFCGPSGQRELHYAASGEPVEGWTETPLYTADQLQALIEERDRLREEVQRLRKAAAPEWFYLGDDYSSDQCRFDINEVIDEDYFWDTRMEGDHVVEIATATSCPTIWAVVHCYTEAEKDELQTDDDYSVVEYATEAEARAALAGEKQ